MKRNKFLFLIIVLLLLSSLFFVVSKKVRQNDIDALNYTAVSGDTTYYDFSAATMIPADYSYSTVFYSENTEFIIYSQAGTLTQKTNVLANGKPVPFFSGVDSGIIKMLITNSAVNKNNQMLDVLVTIDNIVKWRDDSSITFGPTVLQFLNSQNNPVGDTYDYMHAIETGDVLGFYLAAYAADCNVSLKYYVHGTYNNNTGTGTLGGIRSVNSFYYDIDVPNSSYPTVFLKGNEGIAPTVGKSSIYYNKNGIVTTNNQSAHFHELENGIASKDLTVNTNGIWYANSAFMRTWDLNSEFKFRYGGVNCGITYTYASPYPFEFTAPQKKISGNTTEFTSGDSFDYIISQHVPNNYYNSNIKFSEIYPNLYDDSRLKKLVIKDVVPSNLTITNTNNVKVYDENNTDVTYKFTVSVSSQTVTATARVGNFNDSTFYNHTYSLKIPVKVKSGVNVKTITNSATSYVSSDLNKPDVLYDSNDASINIYYNVLVEYRDEYSGTLIDSVTMKKYPGDSYSTTQKSFNNYDYSRVTGDATSGTITNKELKVTYYYKKKAVVTSNHYLLDSNGQNPSLVDTITQDKHYGDSYSTGVSDKVNANYYTLREQPSGANGTVTKDSIVINYYYVLNKGNVVVHHYKDGTTDKLAADETYNIDFGQRYETHEQEERTEKNYILSRIAGDPAEGTVEKNSIVVIYYYKLRDSIIDAKIEKTAIKEINDLNKSITYEIIYNASVSDYEGDATIKIVDTLPFKIDAEKSELSDGVYNEDKNTITWEEEWKDILATVETPATKEIKKEITVSYVDLNIHTKEIYNRVLGTTILSTIEKEEEMEDHHNTEVKIPGKVIIHYYLEDSNDKLHDDLELKGYIDDVLTSKAVEIKGYKLVNKTDTNKHMVGEKDTEFVYYYSKIPEEKKDENPNTSKTKILFVLQLSLLLLIIFGFYKFILKKKIYKL